MSDAAGQTDLWEPPSSAGPLCEESWRDNSHYLHPYKDKHKVKVLDVTSCSSKCLFPPANPNEFVFSDIELYQTSQPLKKADLLK